MPPFDDVAGDAGQRQDLVPAKETMKPLVNAKRYMSMEGAVDAARAALVAMQAEEPGAWSSAFVSAGRATKPYFWRNPVAERGNWEEARTRPDFEFEQHDLTLANAADDLRVHSYVPGEGAAVLVEFYLSPAGEFSWWMSRDAAPRGADFGPMNVADDLKMFPRVAEHIPEWMRVRLGD